MDYFILGIIGIILGLVASLLGVGVGILSLLVFAYYLEDLGLGGFDSVRAIFANNVTFVGLLFGALAIRYARQSGIALNQLLRLTITSVPIAVLLTWTIIELDWLSTPLFYTVFCISIGFSVYTLLTHRESSFLLDCKRSGQERAGKFLLMGALSGLFQGTTSAESSTVIVPFLNRYCDMKIERAIALATSSIAITLLAMSATFHVQTGFGSTSFIQWHLLIPMWAGTAIGGFLPFGMLSKVGLQLASYVLSFFLFIVALRLLFFEVLSLGI
ncbi:MAG: sulfite exporter TauE/SafE family protein [Cyclobacteriaceae bacterium]